MNKEEIKEDIFECKMYITDLETEQKSKEIGVEDLIFDDYIEFEFGNYDDEDYGTLPYKDFKFFINDYSVTFYSPQYENLKQKNQKYKEVIDTIKNILNSQIDYREFVDIVNAIEDVIKEVE